MSLAEFIYFSHKSNLCIVYPVKSCIFSIFPSVIFHSLILLLVGRYLPFLFCIYCIFGSAILFMMLFTEETRRKGKLKRKKIRKRKIIYKYYFRSLNYHVITFDYRSYGDSSQIGTKVQNINLKERKIIMWLCQGFIFEILSMDKTANLN